MARFAQFVPKALLIDLSGTLHIEDLPTRAAIEAIQKLRKFQMPFLFVSNTSKESSNSLLTRLHKIGFTDIRSNEIFTSLSASAKIIQKDGKITYPFLSEDSLHDFPKELMSKNHNGTQKTVLLGLAPDSYTYDNLNYAFNLLLDPECQILAINKSRYFKSSTGLNIGSGVFVEALQYSSGKTAKVVGKPSENFFREAVSTLSSDLSLSDCVMIGDDVKDDIEGAIKAGIGGGVLVRTGKFHPDDEGHVEKLPNQVSVFDDLGAYVDFLSASISTT